MGVRVQLARSSAERRAIYALRHRVYVDQGGFLRPRESGLIHDEWDALGDDRNTNFVAMMDGRPIGGVRLTIRADDHPTSSDHLFDFAPHFLPDTVRASGSMLCVDQTVRGHRRLVTSMMSMFYHYAWSIGVEELYGCVNPDIWPSCRAVGARKLCDDEHLVDERGLPYVPFILVMRDMTDRFMSFIRRHDLKEFLGVWSREFHAAGDAVYRAGDPADVAYVVVAGEAEARLPDGRAERLGRPLLFGDEEMLVGAYRPFDVVAATDLDLIALDRATFFEKVASQPGHAFQFARAMFAEEGSHRTLETPSTNAPQAQQAEDPPEAPVGNGGASEAAPRGNGRGGQRPMGAQRGDEDAA